MPDIQQMIRHKAVMKANFRLDGSVWVRCPYCLILSHLVNEVNITRFIEQAGKKEVRVTCSKGHDLKFRTVDQWREERQKAGIQKRPGDIVHAT